MAKDLITVNRNGMTPAQFGDLAEVPPEIEWLANLTNPKTRRAYKNDVEEFVRFTGLRGFGELRDITRAHRADAGLRRSKVPCRPGPSGYRC
jgi:integrase/recombinase XerD